MLSVEKSLQEAAKPLWRVEPRDSGPRPSPRGERHQRSPAPGAHRPHLNPVKQGYAHASPQAPFILRFQAS